MMLIDQNGDVAPTRLTKSVQIRDYKVLAAERSENSELRLSRDKLFMGEAAGLRPVGAEQKEFPVFSSHGIDPFEMLSRQAAQLERHQSTILGSCASCHRGSGIHSVLSYTQEFGTLTARTPELIACGIEEQARSTVSWKRGRHDLGLLQGLWPH
ncbi:MAG TPA: hypothetical protein VKB88_34225 [Bryobacteraceae bacterium]|nr:hypothetical protein [Bryobacteraceae bacterium]